MGYRNTLLQLFTDILKVIEDPVFISELRIGMYNNYIPGLV